MGPIEFTTALSEEPGSLFKVLQNSPKSFNHFSVSAVNDIQITHSVFGFGILAFKFHSLQYKRAIQKYFLHITRIYYPAVEETSLAMVFLFLVLFCPFLVPFCPFGFPFCPLFQFLPKIRLVLVCWMPSGEICMQRLRGRGCLLNCASLHCITSYYITFGYIALHS